MTINSNGCPGKTCHLKDTATRSGNKGMRVICVHAAETAFRLSAYLPWTTSPGDKTRIFWSELSEEHGHCLFMGKPGSGRGVTRQQVPWFLWPGLTSAGSGNCIPAMTERIWLRISVRTAGDISGATSFLLRG